MTIPAMAPPLRPLLLLLVLALVADPVYDADGGPVIACDGAPAAL